MSYTLHVVSHTHWDREWYLPFENFRLKLVDLIDRLLDLMEQNPEFCHFNLDGQGIVLEDYLAIRPENEERLQRLIADGRITIGPWYVLNDEFLVSGEATVRSLLIGHKVVSRFGPVMKVGYLPDQFGNISQMPQILRNFGIDNCIFGRGWQAVDGRPMEFAWVAPDGSEVMASLMAFWYNNAQTFPADPKAAVAYAQGIRDMMAPIAASGQLLLMNGVDHLEAQYNLPACLAAIRGNLDGDEIVHSTLPAYVEGLRKDVEAGRLSLQKHKGELREDRGNCVLAGVLSARTYLKQANSRCQRLLENCAEPACTAAAFLARAGDGQTAYRYPAGELEYAWKLLLQNHPHDSICGCSLDEVHDEMMSRFTKVEQVAGDLRARALGAIARRVNVEGPALMVFNPLTWERSGLVRATAYIPLGEPVRDHAQWDPADDWPALEIIAPDGSSVPYTLISSRRTGRSVLHPERLPLSQWVREFKVEFMAEKVPAMGYATYRLKRAERMPRFQQGLQNICAGCATVDSGVVSLQLSALHKGELELQRGADDEQYLSHISSLEDVGDVGDEYNFRSPARQARVMGCGFQASRVTVDGPASREVEFQQTLTLPEAALPDGSARAGRTVDCPVTLRARVFPGSRRVEFQSSIDNRARDHRLRAIFSTEAEGAETSVAGGSFDAVERPLRLPEDWANATPSRPMDGWVDISNGRQGLAVLVDGLKEFELYGDENRTVAITLLRCVGALSAEGDFPAVIHTPGAQCQGRQTARYAVYPHDGDWKQAKVWKEALDFQIPLQAVEMGDLDNVRTIETFAHDLPLSLGFVSITPDEFVPSALKKEDNGNGVVLRFYNILDEKVSGSVHVRGARKAWRSSMAEERQEELPLKDECVEVSARGREIVTLIFEV